MDFANGRNLESEAATDRRSEELSGFAYRGPGKPPTSKACDQQAPAECSGGDQPEGWLKISPLAKSISGSFPSPVLLSALARRLAAPMPALRNVSELLPIEHAQFTLRCRGRCALAKTGVTYA
jgi:hypothetical protein